MSKIRGFFRNVARSLRRRCQIKAYSSAETSSQDRNSSQQQNSSEDKSINPDIQTSGDDKDDDNAHAAHNIEDAPAIVTLQHGDQILKAIAPIRELLERLQAAIQKNREIREAEHALEAVERSFDRELELIKAEAERLLESWSSRSHNERLDELEKRDEEIRDELEVQQADVMDLWMAVRDEMGQLLESLEEVFVRSGLLPMAETKEGERDGEVQKANRHGPVPGKNAGSAVSGESYWPIPTHDRSRSVSTTALSRESRRAETRLSQLRRRSKTHHDLRSEVERLENELDSRKRFEHQLLQDYERARRDVAEAERQWDLVEERHDREERQFQARLAAGVNTSSATVFDLKLVLDKQRLTRNLIEAEEDYEEAKAKAVREGIHLGDDDRSSGFVSLESDGYRESQGNADDENLIPEQFLDWMVKIPDHASPDEPKEWPKVDEWESTSVEGWDSVSVVAKGSDRKRIDRWARQFG